MYCLPLQLPDTGDWDHGGAGVCRLHLQAGAGARQAQARISWRPAHTGVLLCPFEDMSGVSRFLERKDELTGLRLSMAEWLGVEALDLLGENAEALAKAGMSGLQRADTLLLEFTAPGEEETLNGLEELLALRLKEQDPGVELRAVSVGEATSRTA